MLKVTAEGTTFTPGLRQRKGGWQHMPSEGKLEKELYIIDDGSTRGNKNKKTQCIAFPGPVSENKGNIIYCKLNHGASCGLYCMFHNTTPMTTQMKKGMERWACFGSFSLL